jgi:hypothetical protein
VSWVLSVAIMTGATAAPGILICFYGFMLKELV